MKIGVSSYSFNQAIHAGRLTQYTAIDEAARLGFAAMDFSVMILPGETALEAAPKLRRRAEEAQIEIVNYAVGNDFLLDGMDNAVEQLKRELIVAAELGVRTFRHDATAGFRQKGGKMLPFTAALPELADGYRRVTEYAKTLSIRTMVENHGFYCQDSDRVEALIRLVGHDNFGVLLDVGNFVCADEDCVMATARLAPYAFHVHAKDFHKKSASIQSPGIGWSLTRSGVYVRGAIIGHGEVPVAQCLRNIAYAGYDGAVSIEFEGIEDCILGIEEGKRNLIRMLNAIQFR